MRKTLLLISMALTLGVAGCGDDEAAGGNCFDYGSFDGTSPATTFADVSSIFTGSCGLSASCHSQTPGPADRPYLGSDPMAVRTENVGVASMKEPGMMRIAAGDPANSFLMHKIDDTLQCEDLTCAADLSCGTPMPQGGTLTDPQKDTIRRWIAQGAPTN